MKGIVFFIKERVKVSIIVGLSYIRESALLLQWRRQHLEGVKIYSARVIL